MSGQRKYCVSCMNFVFKHVTEHDLHKPEFKDNHEKIKKALRLTGHIYMCKVTMRMYLVSRDTLQKEACPFFNDADSEVEPAYIENIRKAGE